MTLPDLDHHWSRFLSDNDYRHQLLRACINFGRLRISASDPQREDIAHDAAWRAWARFGTLEPTVRFARWYCRVLRNVKRDACRASNTRARYEASAASTAIGESAFTLDERQRMLEAAGEHRKIVSLLLEGYKLEEVADQLLVSVRTIRRRLATLNAEAKNV